MKDDGNQRRDTRMHIHPLSDMYSLNAFKNAAVPEHNSGVNTPPPHSDTGSEGSTTLEDRALWLAGSEDV